MRRESAAEAKGELKRLWAELRVAGAFLTRFPVARDVPCDERRLGRSMALFPVVGLLLGLLLVGVDRGLACLYPRTVSDAILILILVLATAGLHLDGLADTADGISGGRDRESALRIMKDSRIGAMGAIALVLVLLLKYLTLHAVPAAHKAAALFLAPASGRWVCVVLASFSPYVRPGGGTGAFSDHVGAREVVIATVTITAAAVILLGRGAFPFLLFLGLAGTGLFFYFRKKMGGVTGDILGASVETVEVLTLMMLIPITERLT